MSKTLTFLARTLAAQNLPWDTPRPVGIGNGALLTAWAASDDPHAMLLVLAAIHPEKNVGVCELLARQMSFLPIMQRLAGRQARAQPGMNYNGPDLFRFLYLAQRVRQALADLAPAVREASSGRICETLRSVVPDPLRVPTLQMPQK